MQAFAGEAQAALQRRLNDPMRRAAIVAPLRTPVGTFGGGLRSVPVETLGAAVVRASWTKPDWTRR